ncbi:hypothetical protein ABTX81_28110 [Kitasatospora sp. NPDC097605]|uniref:hypothetical protein n=1 Tax=Kitasatospora sp. NPDC097605 TaxID=3157226 RepID=UPI0033200F06
MARFTPQYQQEDHEIEFWEVEFTEEEWAEFRKGPHAFLKRITEADGQQVNRLLVDAALLEVAPDGGICHGHITRFHIKSGPERSTYGYSCSGLWE